MRGRWEDWYESHLKSVQKYRIVNREETEGTAGPALVSNHQMLIDAVHCGFHFQSNSNWSTSQRVYAANGVKPGNLTVKKGLSETVHSHSIPHFYISLYVYVKFKKKKDGGLGETFSFLGG